MKRVAVIGGGVAGMQTALRLAEQGVEPVIIEKEAELGGKLRGWHVLFPSFTPASEILTELRRRIAERGIEVMTRTEARGSAAKGFSSRTGVCWHAIRSWSARASRFSMPRSRRNTATASTTTSLRRSTSSGCSTKAAVARADGSRPRRIAFPLRGLARREGLPAALLEGMLHHGGEAGHGDAADVLEADVFNFYMDIRMFGPGYEEMYREAQQKYNIHFIRGRISEASPMIDGRVQIKAEDTLTGRPLRMSVDMLILIVGMRANDDNAAFAEGGRAEPCAERLHGAARHVPRQREEQCRGYFLCRDGHGAEEYRREPERRGRPPPMLRPGM